MQRRAVFAAALVLSILAACLVTLGPVFAKPDYEDKKYDKYRSDNLCGTVFTTRVNQAPGALPYEPLEAVEVTVSGTKLKAVTDSHGTFVFKVKPGEYTITATKAGVGMVTKVVNVSRNQQRTMVTIILNPGSTPANSPGFGMGGRTASVMPGTAYVALAAKGVPGTPAGSSARTGGSMSTTQSYRQMLLLSGGNILGPGASTQLPPSMKMPGDAKIGQQTSTYSVNPNSLMMVNGDAPGNPGYKELNTQPYWTAFNASGTRLYVSTSDKMIQVFDAANDNLLLTSIPAGGIVTDLKLSADGNYIMATVMSAAPCVILIDPVNNAPQRSIPLPRMRTGESGQPRAAAINREATRMFVALGTATSGEVLAIDLYTGVPQNALPVGANPTGLALSPDGRFIYVANSSSGDVSVIDAWTFKEMGRVRVGVSPQRVAVTPDGSKVFVTNKGSDNVTVINGMNQSPIATVPVGKGPCGIDITSDGTKVFVACTGSGNVSIIDGRTGGLLNTTSPIPQSVPWGVTCCP